MAHIQTKGELTQSRIVETSMKLFSKNGIHNTSMQLIADKCKVKQPLIFHYFSSKDDLFKAAIQKALKHQHDIVSATMNDSAPALDRIALHFSLTKDWAINFKHEAKMILMFYDLAATDPAYSKFLSESLLKNKERYRNYIEAGKREKIFQTKEDSDRLSSILHSYVHGSILNLISVSNPVEYGKEIERNWKVLINSLLKVKSKKPE